MKFVYKALPVLVAALSLLSFTSQSQASRPNMAATVKASDDVNLLSRKQRAERDPSSTCPLINGSQKHLQEASAPRGTKAQPGEKDNWVQ